MESNGLSPDELLVFAGLLFLSACFSASETAFFSLQRIKLKLLEEDDRQKKSLILKLLSLPRRLLIAILMGNTFVNISIAAVASGMALNYSRESGCSESMALSAGTMIATFLIVLFGEIIPKNFAYTHNERLSRILTMPAFILVFLLKPLLVLIIKFTELVLDLFGITKDKLQEPFITHEDIETIFTGKAESPILKSEEQDMIEQVFEFEEQCVREIMTPRHGMVCISRNAGFKEVMDTFRDQGYSRYPVYQGVVDNIVGILYVKDFLSIILKNSPDDNFNLKDFVHKAYFVPESKKVSDLFRDLKMKKLNIAMVVDEFGGTEGLVTMEDILEEVVGEISDEYDEEAEEPDVLKTGEREWDVSGSTILGDLEESLELEDYFSEEEDVYTVGGLIFSQLGRIPVQRDVMHYKGLVFTVMEMTGNRISRVKICLRH
ncbi:MAG: hemolysin family protein [Candidatus Wallbacteria bacterium]|nr:hemolysin family protein [Candidatus Wallbacteria bacterium]